MIVIADLTPDDQPLLRKLFLDVRRTAFDWLPSDSFHLSDFDEETKGEYILVAHLNSRVVGFISVWMQEHFIHHVYVDTASQHQGVGKALLQELFHKTKATFRLKCLIKNQAALTFYKHYGFIEKAQVADRAGDYILFEYTS